LRRRNTVVGGKCALPSALLVSRFFVQPTTGQHSTMTAIIRNELNLMTHCNHRGWVAK